MHINKLTILPVSKYLPKVVIKEPSLELVNQQLIKVSRTKDGLPESLLKKFAKQKNIPEFVNVKSYVGKSYSVVEDARVLGAENIDFFS